MMMFVMTKNKIIKLGLFLLMLMGTAKNNASNTLDIPVQISPECYRSAYKKHWTFIVYMAADNDLRGFAARNIKQMAAIGSNNNINILVHLDIKISGNKKITRRYYIENNRILHVNADDPSSQKMDSGDPQSLVSCCKWATTDYPAEHYALILWNHGTGMLDPASGRIINPTELFTFNPAINKFELDRTVGFFDFINAKDAQDRGICWDDTTGNFLTNQKLHDALEEICATYLQGKKFSIIGFDACLMMDLEIANILKPFAEIMVGSQEVELGTGWNYQRALLPFQTGTADPLSFAQNIVRMYGATYNTITDDYTQSAWNLSVTDELENNVNTVATLLLNALQKQEKNSIRIAIQASRNKELCTHFDEPSYIDLHHFYTNLQANLKHIVLHNQLEQKELRQQLNSALERGLEIIKKGIIANITGKNLKMAQGLSIYMPERRIHHSYKKTTFAQTNKWYDLLVHCLTV